MPGELQGRTVLIHDEREANKVHNKGYPGIPQSGGSLVLGLLEAAFLMDEKDFTVEGIDHLADLFHHAGQFIPEFEVQYLIYRTLKLRGFFVKLPDHHFIEVGERRGRGEAPSDEADPSFTGERHFRLLPRGSRPSVPAAIHVLPISEREGFSLATFRSFSAECTLRGVEGLIGIVDEDGDVTFYSVKTSMPVGDCPATAGRVLPAKLGQNRIMMPQGKGVTLLNERGFFGQVMGSMLHLSLIEALYLVECGKIEIEGIESLEELRARATVEQRDIGLRYPVYRALREKGVRVKTGFKYGTHFRAYSQNPDTSHADFLVHVLEDGTEVDWQVISRAVRVAHGVRKRILFTSPGIMGTGQGIVGTGPDIIGTGQGIMGTGPGITGIESKEGESFLELAWTRP